MILAAYLALVALLIIACDAVLFPKGNPMDDCEFGAVHEDILKVAEDAANLAYNEFADAALDQHVIASAVINTLISRSVVPPAIMADITKHTRAAIEKKIADSAS